MPTVARQSIGQLQDRLNKKQLSSVELVEESLKRANGKPSLGMVFLSTRNQRALEDAKASDERRRQGKTLSPLDGIPLAIKDNICMQGERLTCASKFMEHYVSPFDSFLVQRLKQAGAVVIGKTNLDEFAMGSSNENSAFGQLGNPWDAKKVPGGSSGGSAVAVAAGMVSGSFGSDTGGSIRLPASFVGAVGVKPTYGLVSRYGLVAFGSSLDQIGPFAWHVEDAALLLEWTAGHDPADSTSVHRPAVAYSKQLQGDLRGVKIGIPKEYLPSGLDREVRSGFEAALDVLRGLGATPVEISLPHTEYAIGCYYVVASAEASANLARFDGVRYTTRAAVDAGTKSPLQELYLESRSKGFGAEVKRRIMLGTFVLSSGYSSAYYATAQRVRGLIGRDFQQAFTQCDMIVSPTSPTAAFGIGEKSDDPLTMYLSDIFTTPANLAGVPALSVPAGFSKSNMPLGLQLIGKPFDEANLFKAAYQYEQKTQWYSKLPPEGYGGF